MARLTAKEFGLKTDEELATIAERSHPLSYEYVLIREEWLRRERLKQHELDLKLIAKQVRWMKFSIIAVIAAAIISSCLTYSLSHTTEIRFQEMTRQTPQQPTISSLLSSPSETKRGHRCQMEIGDKLNSEISSQPPISEKHE